MENYADRSKWTLEDFDVERAKRGDLVCTREGEIANITNISYLPFPYKTLYPLTVALYKHESYNRGISCGIDGYHIKGKESKYDLFHPVPVKEVKKKRIKFDAELVGEEGVEVATSHPESVEFTKLLTTSLNSTKPMVAQYKMYPTGEDVTRHLYADGRHNLDRETVYDLFLLVPDTEPALPSMQEVANTNQFRNESKPETEDLVPDIAMPQSMWYSLSDNNSVRKKAIVLLMNVAEFVNDGWEPDFENSHAPKYHFQVIQGGVSIAFCKKATFGQILFKSEEAANYAREILNSWEPGDAILKRALGVNS